MPVTTAVLVAVLAFGASFEVIANAQNASTAPLSLHQLESLLEIKAPDSVVASEVRQRGVSFPVDRATIERLRRNGAGPATVRLFTGMLRRTALVVETEAANAEVLVNGRLAATADASGRAQLRLDAGAYDLTVRAPQRRELKQKVTVGRTADQVLRLPLAWSVGFVHVSANIAGASLQLNTGEVVAADQQFERVPGTHELRISHVCCAPENATVTVTAGQASKVEVRLKPTAEFLTSSMTAAREAARRGDVDRAQQLMATLARLDDSHRNGLLQLADEAQKAGRTDEALALASAALKSTPDAAEAHKAYGQALLFKNRWSDAIPSLWRAVEGREKVVVPVRHHRYGFSGDRTCGGFLELSFDRAQFESRCDSADTFVATPAELKLEIARGFPGALRLKVPQPKGKTRTFTFYSLSARAVAKGTSTVRDMHCDATCVDEGRMLTMFVLSVQQRQLRNDVDTSRWWR